MTVTSAELASARELIASLLEAMGLDAYLFEVEPKEEHWELKIECANEEDDSWTATSMQIANHLISAAASDHKNKGILHEFLEHELLACKRSSK
jgi:hypothetical protein